MTSSLSDLVLSDEDLISLLKAKCCSLCWGSKRRQEKIDSGHCNWNPPSVHLDISEYPECSISSLVCSSWWKDLFLKLVNYPSCLNKTILEYWGHYQELYEFIYNLLCFSFHCLVRGFCILFLWSGRPWTPCSFWAFSCYVLEVWKSDLPLFCWYGMITYFFLLLRSC